MLWSRRRLHANLAAYMTLWAVQRHTPGAGGPRL